MFPALIIGLPILLFLIWFFGTYNGLVTMRNHVKESWAGIDTELKRRHDLIPNLVEVCKGYAAHEGRVFEQVVKARNEAIEHITGEANERMQDENKLTGSLKEMFAVVEAYPELKANNQYLHLQQELVNTEDRIQAARRFYNANVRDLNNRVEQVPSNIIAGIFGFKKATFFQIDDQSVRQLPNVSFNREIATED